MLVFWRQRLVFLATPKTASTSIETALAPHAAIAVLRPPQLKHTNAQRYQKFVAPFIGDGKGQDFVTTALMRAPVDWLGSWYRYRQRPDEVPEKSTLAMSFDDFVRGYCRDTRPEFANVGVQSTFLAPQGQRAVDYIFRYEAMDDFVAFLKKRLGIAIDLPKVNVSPEAATVLSPEVDALFRQTHARDFEIYDGLAK